MNISGSTHFGDSADDIHAFTGSVVIPSGSLKGELYVDTNANKMFIGKFQGGIPVSGSVSASRYATGSDGSIIDLGYTTVDEDGNVSLITTGDGIYVDNNNYWYNNGFFKIGDANQNVQWDNKNLNISASATSSGSFGLVSGVSGSLSRIDGGTIGVTGDILPATHNTSDLGSDSVRFANIYSADVHLSNDNTEGNDVDGTTGNWTIQEGNEDLFIINRKTGKKFKFLLQEVT